MIVYWVRTSEHWCPCEAGFLSSGWRASSVLLDPQLYLSSSVSNTNHKRFSIYEHICNDLNTMGFSTSTPGLLFFLGNKNTFPRKDFNFCNNWNLKQSKALPMWNLLQNDVGVVGACSIALCGHGYCLIFFTVLSEIAQKNTVFNKHQQNYSAVSSVRHWRETTTKTPETMLFLYIFL